MRVPDTYMGAQRLVEGNGTAKSPSNGSRPDAMHGTRAEERSKQTRTSSWSPKSFPPGAVGETPGSRLSGWLSLLGRFAVGRHVGAHPW